MVVDFDNYTFTCTQNFGVISKVIRTSEMDSVVMLFVLYLLNLLNITQGQCFSNGTCVCHCENCTYGCTACLPGWSGSTTNYCQKSNTFFQLPAMDELFDGDSKTYKVDTGHDPYVRSQFNTSAKIDQLDITLVLEYGITYTVSVRNIPYKFLESEICDEFKHSDVSTERTVTVTCKRPLQGKYIVIVASSPSETTLKVFEIERFECSNGTFGEHCSKICPDGCNKQCDKKTGDCVCKNGRWGNSCNRTCPSFCDKNTCNSITGDCFNCVPEYYGVKCDKECSSGCQNI